MDVFSHRKSYIVKSVKKIFSFPTCGVLAFGLWVLSLFANLMLRFFYLINL